MERVSKAASRLVSETELNNLLDILGNLNEEIDILRMQNKKKVDIVALFIFFPICRKKHDFHECPLDNFKICEIRAISHTMKDCPSLPGLKAVYQGENQTSKQSYYVPPRRPWQPHQPDVIRS